MSSDPNSTLIAELRAAVASYLESYVTAPALQTVMKNIGGQARVASLGAMVVVVDESIRRHGVDYDADYLRSLTREEIDARIESLSKVAELGEDFSSADPEDLRGAADYLHEDSSKKYLLSYLVREFKWIAISLLSSSYISTLVLTRAAFELTIGIATREAGSMKDRIHAISFLTDDEKKATKAQWYRLCAWAHPHGKWVKEVCPMFLRHEPTYHPALFSLCLTELTQFTDFFATVAVEKYDLDQYILRRALSEEGVSLDELPLLRSRFNA